MGMMKTLAEEVAEVLGKSEVDDEAINRASDILKMLKLQSLYHNSLHDDTRAYAMRTINRYRLEGTEELYEKVVNGRRA